MGGGWELPGYDVEELVGVGGTGEVWRAVELATGDVVAVKRLRAGAFGRDRLRREAALVSSAAGEHVVRVRDVVSVGADAVLVSDFAGGGSLAGVLAVRGRLAAPEVVTVVGPLAAALADVHDRGIVHADVTPANIVFTSDGRPQLTDFGVARAVGDLDQPVEATVPYAAPEVLAGSAPTPAADVFSLCRVGLAALDPTTAPQALLDALQAGVADDPYDRPDARSLAMDVLSACAAAPVGLVRAEPVLPPTVTTTVPPRTAPPSVEPPPLARHRRVRTVTWHVPRRLAVGAAVVGALVAAVVGGVTWGRHAESSAATLPQVAAPDWTAVVQQLAERRAAAFAAGDTALLDSVYTADASGLGTDRTRLLRLAAAGQHVVGLRDAVGAVQLVSSSADAAALRVTGALAAYTLVDRHDHVVRAVPAAPARTFVMVLRRVDLDWRVQSVHG